MGVVPTIRQIPVILFFALTAVVPIYGQSVESALDPSVPSIQVSGQVVDLQSGQPLEYATVSVFSTTDSTLVTGVATNEKGIFMLETNAESFTIEIAFLGYLTKVFDNLPTDRNIDLRKIEMNPNQAILDEVTVVSERSETVFHLDKRVFNVGKDLSSAGGTALDVLNNVPSLDVNIEGVVSLRGNANVQILINGKPSVMTSGNSNTLGTISAEIIDKVEVITNPSAKYEAEGTTGIINIIIKKDERKGLNGSVTLNTGIPNNHSVGLSLNRRTEKFNLFAQLGAGKRTFLSNYSGRTISGLVPRTLESDGDGEKNEEFYNILLGTDYHVNPYNVITLSGHFAYEFEDEFSNTNYSLFDEINLLKSASLRDEVTDATNPKWEYSLQYKKSFAEDEERSLVASATGSSFAKEQSSAFGNTDLLGQKQDFEQRTVSDYANAVYNFQVDYTHPFSEETQLEVGARYELSDVSNDYHAEELMDGAWFSLDAYTNVFDVDQKVLGIYSTYAYELDHFGVKVGLRVESTNLTTDLRSETKQNKQIYTKPFPSIHTSYKITDQCSMQLGYSRRIHRPGMRDLNPFSNLRDNLNLYFGNPDLLPEYTNSFELTAIQTMGVGAISIAVFQRQTVDVVERVTQAIDTLTITTPQNVGKSYHTGVEVNGKVDATKWLSLLADFNWMYFRRKGTYNDGDFDFNNTRWSSRLTTKIKMPADIDAECRLRYQSASQQLLGMSGDVFYADFGIRKKFMDGRAIVNFSMLDIFNSRRYISEVDQPTFYRYSERQRVGRSVVLGFSYGFGKGEAMEFSGHKQF